MHAIPLTIPCHGNHSCRPGTLIVLNRSLGRLLEDLSVVPRRSLLSTVAVPIVIYGLMPRLHRLRARLPSIS
jgi:hypothetical protein